MDDLDCPPTNGSGMPPPLGVRVCHSHAERLLTLEIHTGNATKQLEGMQASLSRVLFAILGASVAVTMSVLSAAVYIGGQLHAVTELERRVTHLEPR